MMVVLALILWLFSKLLIVGTLIALHVVRQRRFSVAPPLFQRTAFVRGSMRWREGIFGLGACYAWCVGVAFLAIVGQPTGTSLVLNPMTGSPAERAGLARGDRARSVEGAPVQSFDEFREAVARAPEAVSIEVERNGKTLPLRILKDANDRIGVDMVPTEKVAAITALSAAPSMPVSYVAGWIRDSVRALSGTVPVAGSVAVGVVATAGDRAWARVLALLLSKDLGIVAVIYVVILVADTRSRAGYQAAQKSSPA